MKIVNLSELSFAYLQGKVRPPRDTLTLIVKGTYELSPGGVATLLEEQPFSTGSAPYPDDEEGTGPPRYESDFAYFKPAADVIVVGSCHAPGGRPVERCPVTVEVGRLTRKLAVFGDRTWVPGVLRYSVDGPEPFREMPLRWENSFGGAKCEQNPMGKGHRKSARKAKDAPWELPNIEDPRHLIRAPADQPPPVGLAPISPDWTERRDKLGTYDDEWLEKHWPWFPDDFDWSYYNAAPRAQQVKDYLEGDEGLYFENMHAEHPEYECSLPATRARCFIDEEDPDTAGGRRFREVPLNLDTLWVDMDAEQLVLVWRGVARVRSDDLEEIRHLLIGAEDLDQDPAEVDAWQDRLDAHLAAEAAEYEAEPPTGEPAERPPREEIDAEIAKMESAVQAEVVAAGLKVDDKPPKPTPEAAEYEADLLKKVELDKVFAQPEAEAEITREQVEQRAAAGESLEGEDLAGMDLSGAALAGAKLGGAVLTGAVLTGADLSGVDLTEARLDKADLSEAKLTGATLAEADLTEANCAGADLSGAILDGASLENGSMAGAKLHGASAVATVFAGSDLASARLDEANLENADLTGCKLNGALFPAAVLRNASFEEARGEQVDLSGADLTELRAEGCALPGADLRRAEGRESIWTGADLEEADLRYAPMAGADFSGANLAGADLFGADMPGARFVKTDLREARLKQMNLFQGSLERADLTAADARGSNLYGAETLDAILDDVRLKGANLKMTKLAK